ncbi:MAG: hypothetical protein JST11_17130 [Acidobacteria bacterium]|nr:hypothetical protein [Acidobacteriota bacterium]
MFKRILLSGVLAGIAVFLWEGVAHMVLPLGEAGFRAVPDEAAFAASLKTQFQEGGLYLFPAPESRPGMTSAEKQKAMDAAMKQARIGPSGLLLIHPEGEETLSPRQFGTQIFADILVMLIAAWVLSKTAFVRGYPARVAFVAALALFPILEVHVPYWNWYGFPATFILAASVVHAGGFLVGGLVLAKMVTGARG